MLGTTGGRTQTVHFTYSTHDNAWDTRAPPTIPRTSFGLAALKGNLYAAGGFRAGSRQLLDTVEVYGPENDAWRTETPIPQPAADCTLVGAGGRLYLVGGLVARRMGATHQVTGRVGVFSPNVGKWTDGIALQFPRREALLAVTERRLHVMGGLDTDGRMVPDEMLDIATRTWLEAPQPHRRHAGGAAAVVAGAVYRFATAPGVPEISERCAFERVLYVHARVPI